MSALKVTLVQADLHWENPAANRKALAAHLQRINTATDLVILPEMFSTGFSMHARQLAEPTDGPTVQWMAVQAEALNTVVAGSLIIESNGRFYNRLIWMPPDRKYRYYDKRHLFRLSGEEKVYGAGRDRLIVPYNGWNICPQVCYDLRFPVWNRNQNDYDLLFFNANWPERRIKAWHSLLRARAIENQAYVIGVNRVGDDGHEVYHSGHSSVFDPLGELLFQVAHQEAVHTVTLSDKHLKAVRKKFAFLQDADNFKITP